MTTKEAATFLREARELITPPERFAQGDFAMTADGSTTTDPSEAVCYCTWGALAKVHELEYLDIGDRRACPEALLLEQCALAISDPEALAASQHKDFPIIHVNDELGHAATLEMFDCAIKKAEA